jgi:TonB-linked SusC/RagA family outer membrane protein
MKSISEVKVSISLDDQPLSKAFSQLERKTDFKFTYNPNTIPLDQRVSLDLENATVYQVLENLIRQTNLSFVQINKNIHVKLPSGSAKAISIQEPEFIDIQGKVTDATGQPLPGVTVIVEGTTTGTVTDIDGNYSLSASEGDVLVFSFVGFESRRVTVGNQTTIDIQLAEDAQALEEVVVVGYGTVKKSDLTGSVSSVSGEELQRQPITTLDQGLQGLAAGVQVQQTSGAPGGAVTLKIRGTNSISAGNEPLYVIDGLPIVANNAATPGSPNIVGFGGNSQPGQPPSPLSGISPNDIESIEILKDASATALYGARASNGVVLITTKRGKSGQAVITFDSYVGVQEISNEVEFMSAEQHRTYLTDAINSGASTLPIEDIPSSNTDWFDLVQAKNPIIQNYNLGVQGGTDKLRYSVSGNYFNQEGILKNTGIDRSVLRVNLDFEPLERLKVGVSTNTSYTQNQIQLQNGTGNYQTTNSPFTWAQWTSPLQPLRSENGEFSQDYFDGNPMSNPASLVADNVVNEIRTFRSFGTVNAEYRILKNLRYKLNVGVDLSSAKRNSFFPNTHPFGRFVNGLGAVSNSLLTNWLIENLVYYDLELEDHKLNLIGGITSQRERVESSVLQGQDFAIDNLSYNSIQQAAIRDGVSGVNNWTLQSFFAQANYSLKNKYLFTANFRADGSSKFGRNNRWGFFPSGAFAWQIHEEKFFTGLKNIFSDMKFRASYGVVGNQEIPANLAFAAIRPSNRRSNLTNDPGSEGVNGLQLASLANPDLRWESTSQVNFGLDFGFFENRVNVSTNYYQKTTKDLLLATPLPATAGFAFAVQNVGEVINNGFEFTLNSVNIDSRLKWTSTLNLSSNRNEVVSLASGIERTFINIPNLQNIDPAFVLEVGQPLGAYYGYQFEGIYQQDDPNIPDGFSPGDPIYTDISGPDGIPDGIITSDDRTVIGDPNPDLIFGFNNTLEFGGFDLSVFFNGEFGKEMVNWNRTFWETGLVNFQRTPNALDAWSSTNPSNTIPRVGFSNSISSQGTEALSSRLVENGSFVRLRNVSLGYTFPLRSSSSINSLRLYLTGQNLLTITNYSGFDPEANFSAGSSVIQGFDFGSYPIARTFLVGIQARF